MPEEPDSVAENDDYANQGMPEEPEYGAENDYIDLLSSSVSPSGNTASPKITTPSSRASL
jgi:hypothetical protein